MTASANLIRNREFHVDYLGHAQPKYDSFEGRNVNRSIMEERNKLLDTFLTEELAR